MDWSPIILSFELALITTVILFFLALPLAYWLAHTKSRFKVFVEALVSLPLVLPPTVIGFYLLLIFGPSTAFGTWLIETLGAKLIFSFPGLVVASIIYSFPFMVQPLQSGFASLPPSIREASMLMGKSKFITLRKVLLPNIKPAILTGAILSFAHTLGEFGIVYMIGGSKVGQTRVASIAIYDEVELLHYGNAHTYSLILIGLTFAILIAVYTINRRLNKPFTF